jgi:DNA invertase Pin-like site-specific DNA recombinase
MVGKVEPTHLRRAAYVYVRQSTMAQVERNTESLERQYELVDRAVALGWAGSEVVVVDRDLGRSGKTAVGREGFERLVAEVGLGKVGIVLGIEVSRLARGNSDWYQLLDLCALTNTLIVDADGIYHPGLHNDRLLLGLKGTMAEAELHVLRARMRDGALHKAAKGQLRLPLPAGYEYDELGQVRITPDEAVADAIHTVFAYFDELSSARQVMLRLVAEGHKLPRRAPSDRHVRWMPASYRAVLDMLANPCYAGVYAFGRKRVQRRIQDGVVRERVTPVPREEWHTCLVNHHPGYITFEQYEANQERVRANRSGPRSDGAAREGRALLQGLGSAFAYRMLRSAAAILDLADNEPIRDRDVPGDLVDSLHRTARLQAVKCVPQPGSSTLSPTATNHRSIHKTPGSPSNPGRFRALIGGAQQGPAAAGGAAGAAPAASG